MCSVFPLKCLKTYFYSFFPSQGSLPKSAGVKPPPAAKRPRSVPSAEATDDEVRAAAREGRIKALNVGSLFGFLK